MTRGVYGEWCVTMCYRKSNKGYETRSVIKNRIQGKQVVSSRVIKIGFMFRVRGKQMWHHQR